MVRWLKQCLVGNPSTRSKFAPALMSAVLISAALAYPALADSDTGVRALHDGVLVAPEHGLVYMMTPDGGIDGINLDTGVVSWRTEEAAKPLALAGDLLIAQAEPDVKGYLPIVSLDTRKAGGAQMVARIALPSTVRARIDDGLGKSFRTWVTADGHLASIVWNSSVESPSGTSPDIVNPTISPAMDASSVAPTERRVNTAVRHEGAVQLDLISGRSQEVANSRARVQTLHPLRELSADKGLTGVAGRQFLSIDGRHVLVSERQAGGEIHERYRWTLFELATGEQLGQVSNRVSAAPFLVAGKGLIYTSSPVSYHQEGRWVDSNLTLRSVDLVSGVERWSHELRDTQYRGPFPQ